MDIQLNIILVSLFLLANLVVGLMAVKKIKTMDDYALANRSLGGGVMIATLVATLFEVQSVEFSILCDRGVINLIKPFMFTFFMLLLGLFVFPKLLAFKKERTLADVMHTMYGKFGCFYTLLVMTIFSFGVIAGQLVGLVGLSNMLQLNLTQEKYNPVILMAVIGGLITVYTCLGGVRSVAKTDVLQFLVIVLGIIGFFIAVTWEKSIFNILQKAKVASPKRVNFFADEDLLGHLFPWFFVCGFPTFVIAPPIIQRVLMIKKRKDVQKMFTSFAFVYPVLCILVTIASLKLFTLPKSVYEQYIGQAKYSTSTSTYIEKICESTWGQVGFLLAIVAIIMSTMDSFLNALAIMWVNDVIIPLKKKKKLKPIQWVHWISLLFGIGTIGLSMLCYQYDVRFTHVINYAILIVSNMSIPFLMGLRGLKPSPKALIASVLTFWSVFVLLFVLYMSKVAPVKSLIDFIDKDVFKGGTKAGTSIYICMAIWPFAMFAHILTFFGVHLWENKAFVWIDRETENWQESSRNTLGSYFQWLRHPIRWCLQKEKTYGIRHFPISLVTMVYFFIPFTLGEAQGFSKAVSILRVIPIVLCFPMMVREHWHKRLEKHFSLFYYPFMSYAWVFVNTLSLCLIPQEGTSLWHLAIGIFALGLMIDWRSFVVLELVGVTLAWITQWIITGRFMPDFGANGGFPLLLSIALPCIFLATFKRHNDQQTIMAKKELKKIQEAKNMMLLSYEDSHKQVYETLHKNSSMMTLLAKVSAELQTMEGMKDNVRIIKGAMGHFFHVGNQSQEYLDLTIKETTLNKVLDEARSMLINQGFDIEHVKIHIPQSKSTLSCDLLCTARLIANAVWVTYEQLKPQDTYGDAPIHLFIDEAWLDYDLKPPYEKKPEKSLRITCTTADPATCTLAEDQSYKPYAENQQIELLNHICLLENKRITKAQYGHIEIQKQALTLTQTYVLPLDLLSLKPKMTKFATEDLRNVTQIEAPEDKIFLKAIADKKMNLDYIGFALKVAKHCHADQRRKSGEPYYFHPMEVATILLQYTTDEDVIVAALLHDTVEDSGYSPPQMFAMFNEQVMDIVVQVSHLYNKAERPRMKLEKKETLKRLLATGNSNSLLVKLIDRLHNMRTIGAKEPEKQIHIAKETIKIFIPIAQELNLQPVADELHKLCTAILASQG